MPEEALAFLSANRIGVISVQLPDGSPHAATIHFAYNKDASTFICLTSRMTRKVQSMRNGEKVPAAFVVGTDEEQMRTFQLNGIAQLTDSNDYKEIYFDRFPEKREKAGGPNEAVIIFTATWWRYTDMKAAEGRLIIESQ